MKLQKATRCALFAILELARHPERQISAAEIAETYGVSVNHLAKVLRCLARAGLVEAACGGSGGYRFSGNAKRVTLYQVAEIDGIAVSTLKSITLTTLLKIAERHAPLDGEA